MYDAICLYGWDSFYHDVVETFTDKEKAYECEARMICMYRTTDARYGFNLQSGGENPVQNADSIKKSASKRRGIHLNLSEDARNRIRQSVLSRPGLHDSRPAEVRNKISRSKTGTHRTDETKQKLHDAFGVPVLCVELNKVYPSMTDAAAEFGLSKCAISAVIKGRNKTAAGYHWQLYNNSECGTTIP